MTRMKRSIVIILIVLMMLLACCAPVTDTDVEQASKPTGTDEKEAKPTAEEEIVTTIYLLEYDRFLLKTIPSYNILNRDNHRRVEVKEFSMDQMKNMYEKLTMEVLAGSGPDIIYHNRYIDRYMDIHRATKQGGLADMDALIANDDDINMEDYNSVIMDAGIIDGKRVIMPMAYNVGYLLAMQETMDYHGISTSEPWTLDHYLSILEDYYASSTEPAQQGLSPIVMLRSAIKGRDLDEELFIRVAKLLKQEYNSYGDDYPRIRNVPEYCGYHLEKNFLFISSCLQGGSELWNLLFTHKYMAEHGAHMLILEFPQDLYIASGFMINENAEHKDAALDFIQYMLEKDAQKVEMAGFDGLPVNRAALDKRKMDMEARYNLGFGKVDPLPDAIRDQFYAYHDSLHNCDYMGYSKYVYYNFIEELLYDYYDDKIDEQELVDSVKSKLFIYSTE